MQLKDGEECDLVKQLLEEYVAGRIPAMPGGETDTYIPVAEKLLVNLNIWFHDSWDDGFPENYVPVTGGLFDKPDD